ncbi:9034_t:CDS:2 [Rhizophagus irregularis]|nr:9034_t:CDS:2 [Rhizophagus irregularis]
MDISSLLLTESEEQSVNLTSSWNFETTPEIPQLPADIIYQILRNFQYCRSSLCKFLQINQTWCHISLIFLWNCPFSVSLKAKNSVLLIRTLLSFLSEQEKSELKLNLTCYESNISKNSTYNYLDYIRVFDLKHFRLSILHWISYLRNNNDDDFFSDSLIVELNKIYKDIPINYSTVNLASEIISNMLFRKCGNNGLQHLVIEYDDIITSNYVISKNIIYLNNDLPKLVNFDFHYKLEGNFDKNLLIDRIVEMFEIMTKSVKNLRWLEANIEHEEHRLPKIGKALVEFIEEQNNLEVLGINEFWMYEESEIYRRICKSQQKSLKHVRFYGMCNFKELIKGLSECKNLITLELLRISKYDSNIIPMNDELEILLTSLPLEQFLLKIDNENSESTIYTQDYWNKIAKSIPDSVIHLGIDFKIEKNMLDMFLKECKAQLKKISLFQRYMLNRHYLQVVVQYAKKNNNLLKELGFLWDPKDFGFISHSNLEDAKKFIKIIGKVEPFNKPFYDIKLNIPHKKDHLLSSFLSCKKG